MIYLLDTVAISETSKLSPDSGMSVFLTNASEHDLRVSVVTLAELRFGWCRLPEGRRRSEIQLWAGDIEEAFDGRILPVDTQVALLWGQLRADVQRRGFTIGWQDLLIAATALHHDLTVVTRNVKDFAPTGCTILNPWETER